MPRKSNSENNSAVLVTRLSHAILHEVFRDGLQCVPYRAPDAEVISRDRDGYREMVADTVFPVMKQGKSLEVVGFVWTYLVARVLDDLGCCPEIRYSVKKIIVEQAQQRLMRELVQLPGMIHNASGAYDVCATLYARDAGGIAPISENVVLKDELQRLGLHSYDGIMKLVDVKRGRLEGLIKSAKNRLGRD